MPSSQSPRALLAVQLAERDTHSARLVNESAPRWDRGISASVLSTALKEANDTAAVRVSLDLPPATRWDSVVTGANASLWALLRTGYTPVNVDSGEWNSTWFGFDCSARCSAPADKDVRQLFSKEQWEEMRGIARVSRLPLLSIIAMNMICACRTRVTTLTTPRRTHDPSPVGSWASLMPPRCSDQDAVGPWSLADELVVARELGMALELSPEGPSTRRVVGCTGVLVADEAGVVLHGRNLDYDMNLRQVTRRVDFVRGGAVVFSSVGHWIGNTGSATVMVPGGWSAEQNTRMAEARARSAQVLPDCRCGLQSRRNQVRKEGPNKGRWFFACGKPWNRGKSEQCRFFEWNADVS